jgi:undecaprenyl diphosphate synthase
MSDTMTSPPADKLPRHVAIIMDGNGRWAKRRHLPRFAGHRSGVEAVRRVVQCAARRGIQALTLFAFSSENWRRPQQEVGLLLDLFMTSLQRQMKMLRDNNIMLRVIGDRTPFDPKMQDQIATAEALTAGNDGLILAVAVNYGGRWDVTQACRALAVDVASGALRAEDITTEHISRHLCLHDLPEPDLFIRTGGEQRISNFLLWQLAYTELVFSELLWPDFDAEAFEAALADYARRQRRFGRTGDQIEHIQGA